MLEIDDFIKKIYEKTNYKLNKDDPIVAELIAQQILIEEFSIDVQEAIDEVNKKIETSYKVQQAKSAELSQAVGKKLVEKLNENFKSAQIKLEKNNKISYTEIIKKVQNITYIMYAILVSNLLLVIAIFYLSKFKL